MITPENLSVFGKEFLACLLGVRPNPDQITVFTEVARKANHEYAVPGDIVLPLKSRKWMATIPFTSTLGHFLNFPTEENLKLITSALSSCNALIEKVWMTQDLLCINLDREKIISQVINKLAAVGLNYGATTLLEKTVFTIPNDIKMDNEEKELLDKMRAVKLLSHILNMITFSGGEVILKDKDKIDHREREALYDRILHHESYMSLLGDLLVDENTKHKPRKQKKRNRKISRVVKVTNVRKIVKNFPPEKGMSKELVEKLRFLRRKARKPEGVKYRQGSSEPTKDGMVIKKNKPRQKKSAKTSLLRTLLEKPEDKMSDKEDKALKNIMKYMNSQKIKLLEKQLSSAETTSTQENLTKESKEPQLKKIESSWVCEHRMLFEDLAVRSFKKNKHLLASKTQPKRSKTENTEVNKKFPAKFNTEVKYMSQSSTPNLNKTTEEISTNTCSDGGSYSENLNLADETKIEACELNTSHHEDQLENCLEMKQDLIKNTYEEAKEYTVSDSEEIISIGDYSEDEDTTSIIHLNILEESTGTENIPGTYQYKPVVHKKTGKCWNGSASDYCKILVEELRLAAALKHGDVSTPEWSKFLEEQAWRCMTLQLLSVNHTNFVKIEVDGHTQNTKEWAFILYNYARLSMIFESFEEYVKKEFVSPLPPTDEVDFSLLRHDEEWILVWMYILRWPEIVEEVALSIVNGCRKLKTASVTRFLHSLAHRFSAYYSRYHVLVSEPLPHLVPLMYARLYLFKAVHLVMTICFNLLGVDSPPTFM
ncbi:uncharacterized protein LOC121877368 isoform X1 [Homarus americanus]|uniref:uncharacterized protein LOC121877368 isoform X1 n=2 Tax=Homarus americanus TaxID=6706 RepID=UPI001C469766|nr:uncharacterized protein LOC121877368 isoform X1 [Homarus americanus]